MNSQDAFGFVAVFYAVANLASMGLELNLRETIRSLRSVRVLGLTLGWSWLVGPALAVLLTKILPMAEPYAIGTAHLQPGADRAGLAASSSGSPVPTCPSRPPSCRWRSSARWC